MLPNPDGLAVLGRFLSSMAVRRERDFAMKSTSCTDPANSSVHLSSSCRIRQMCAYRGLDQSPPKFMIRTRRARAEAGGHLHQRGVQYLQPAGWKALSQSAFALLPNESQRNQRDVTLVA
jgi:hypothetical protein